MDTDLDIDSLVTPARIAITISTLTLVLETARALRGEHGRDAAGWRLLALAGAIAVPATALSAAPIGSLVVTLLPFGVFFGLGLALASQFHEPTRNAFDALSDGQVRTLLGYRAIFGAFLFAGAALELFPPSFAWTAGLGDLAVAWLAHAAPGSLGRGGSRGWRLLVHGVGLADLLQVVVLAMGVVRPWLAAHAEAGALVLGPPLVLPWIGVPLMLALNLHGLRSVFAQKPTDARDTNARPRRQDEPAERTPLERGASPADA
jgi:hypothetical protein